MPISNNKKTKLSKVIRQMKFMQRSDLEDNLVSKSTSSNQCIDDEHWVLDLPNIDTQNSRYLQEPSVVQLRGLLFGRMSFKSFNPTIEKIMKSHKITQDLEEAERKEKEISVDDQEMVERYSTLVKRIDEKFKKKRNKTPDSDNEIEFKKTKRSHKSLKKKTTSKRTFIKPDD